MQRPRCFYYITHIDRLESILKEGILSRSQLNRTTRRNLFQIIQNRLGWDQKMRSIHDENIVQNRKHKTFKGRSLWDYANLYFQVRNPMLFRVIRQSDLGKDKIVVLQVNADILDGDNVGITDGNAASSKTQFFEDIPKGLKALALQQLNQTYWTNSDDAKRKIMAEVLVYDKIPKEKITGIYTANEDIANKVRKSMSIGALNVIPNPDMFFLPEYQESISSNITLAKGDMFFSHMQTFTISVNTVGVMGKGLASRTKYQFPDVYVYYQDLCRQKKLLMGRPALYKREEDLMKVLAEDVTSPITENGHRWFLLFPTKNHWKTNSPIDGIEQGLQHLLKHYKEWGITSIALPSLGCGLGGLNWKDVGPLMCKYLNQMDIKSCIYLPAEGEDIPQDQLNSKFLI